MHEACEYRMLHAHHAVLFNRWHPGPRVPAEAALRLARQNDAERVLSRLEGQKLRGDDYSLQDITKLREICQVCCELWQGPLCKDGLTRQVACLLSTRAARRWFVKG